MFDVGGAAGGPGGVVVGVAESGWPVASVGGAAAVALGDRDPLGAGVEASGAAGVEDLGLSAEDEGEDPCFAGHASGLAG